MILEVNIMREWRGRWLGKKTKRTSGVLIMSYFLTWVMVKWIWSFCYSSSTSDLYAFLRVCFTWIKFKKTLSLQKCSFGPLTHMNLYQVHEIILFFPLALILPLSLTIKKNHSLLSQGYSRCKENYRKDAKYLSFTAGHLLAHSHSLWTLYDNLPLHFIIIFCACVCLCLCVYVSHIGL